MEAAIKVLAELVAVNARIIVVASDPRAQRALFAASHATNQLHGEGYVWISTWATSDVYDLSPFSNRLQFPALEELELNLEGSARAVQKRARLLPALMVGLNPTHQSWD